MIYINDLREMDNSESSIGVIRKWYDEKNHLYIKASSLDKKRRVYHIESVMECIAYEVGKLFGIEVVPYWMDKLHISDDEIIDVCVSKDYKAASNFQSSVSARTLLLKKTPVMTNRSEIYNHLTSFSNEVKVGIDKLILFDYLIDNYDRHMRNIEFMRIGEKIVLSPIFDSGSSLLSDYPYDEDLEFLKEDEDTFEEVMTFAQTQSKSFSHEHSMEIRLVGKEAYHEVNRDIKNEEFKEIVEKYSTYISPLRKEMIITLLINRFSNIIKWSKK
ncbi:hypothetical protein SFC55_25020 [Niallia taxi]|uniref:hypothetical protein n=1 Tax=Niallia taxi TaxID=2499688 RepID=UPI0039829F32